MENQHDQEIGLLKGVLTLLTTLLVLVQFYLLSSKLPADITYNNKTVGFLKLYLEKLVDSFLLWPPLISFLLIHILIQSLFTIIIYFIAKNFATISSPLHKHIFPFGIFFWFICQVNLFLWNGYLFRYSFFAASLSALKNYHFIYFSLLFVTSTLITLVLIYVLIRLILRHPKIMLISLLLVGVIILTFYLFRTFSNQYQFQQTKTPNVIIFITDSLRPDFASSSEKNAPKHVQKYISKSAFFSNSLTLLGRSTPGLVTILSGNYPKTNGARFNLISDQSLRLENSLTQLLRSQGYQTILVADGLQFVNLNKNFGFDVVISPKQGIYDYIFSIYNDTPLSNLLTNTFIGQWLFPYNYANRSAYFTYMPKSFVDLVDSQLVNHHPNKPTLLIVSLAIAHWPYVWAKQPDYNSLHQRYQDSVKQLDLQFNALMKLFKDRGLLKNSIIVTLSDHGDSLGLPGDRIISQQNYVGDPNRLSLITRMPYSIKSSTHEQLGIDTSVGHGTDLLSLSQLETTLAFQFNGIIKPQIIRERVALIDVAPTIVNLLNLTPSIKYDGISLVPIMSGKSNLAEFNRPLFLESEIDMPLIDVTKEEKTNNLSKLISKYAVLFNIDGSTQQLVLKDEVISHLLNEKQRGVIYGDWLLVYFPGKNRLQSYMVPFDDPQLTDCYYILNASKEANENPRKVICYRLAPTMPYFVLVNIKTKKWRILFPNELPQNPVFNTLYQQLKNFYGAELGV